ncbi:MAG: tRNA (adenosine(37)-N6)-threonylcarbamoyltransferase complex dimerization subunit type 1 TsaB [Gemmatimonadales bacterium]
MIALAFDTTSDHLSVAARAADGRTALRSLDGARLHAAALLGLVDEAAREAGGSVQSIGTLALADGPGSFTGLRVGAAVMKALARALPARPGIASASTLLVRAAASAPPHVRVLVVTSALRGEVYAARYRLDLPRSVETLEAPAVRRPEQVSGEADLLVADLPGRLLDQLADRLELPVVRPPLSLPRAEALLALIGVPGGAAPIADPDGWEPGYGRPAEAERRWEEAHGRPLPHPAR